MARYRRHLGIGILVFSASMLTLVSAQPGAWAAQDVPEWTVMVYMAADSEPALPWDEDINEMEAAGPPDWMNVVALVDPLGSGDSAIYEVVADDMDLVIVSGTVDDSGDVIPPSGEVDMASPETLSDFITFACHAYPADRLVLVLWGHSGGWYGMCQDGSALLTPQSLAEALDTATEELGRKLDLIVTDCCTEGVVETACEVRAYADWYVGSEIAVPAQGLRYDLVLGGLAESGVVAPEEFGSMICRTHRTTLMMNSWSAAMAVYDLSAADWYLGSTHSLAYAMKGYVGLYRDTLGEVLAGSAASDLSEWYVDAGDALRRLAGADLPLEVRHQALLTLTAYDALVFYFDSYASPFDDDYGDVANFTGAAVYCPGDDLLGGHYPVLAFALSGWGEVTSAIRLDEPQVANAPGPTLSYADTDGDDEPDEATLHWAQVHDFVSAHVFADTQAGMQLLALFTDLGQDIVVSGLLGELVVSASAWDGTNVSAHHTLDVTLTGQLDVRVTVVSADGPVTDGVTVIVLTERGQVGLSVSDGVFVGAVTVPDDAEYGDLLTVEVRGKNGETIAQNRTSVTGSELVLRVALVTGIDDALGPEVVVPAVLLASCVAAAAIYLRTRRGRGDVGT